MISHNGRANAKKFGTNRNGSQRFRCLSCCKAFTAPHDKPLDAMTINVERVCSPWMPALDCDVERRKEIFREKPDSSGTGRGAPGRKRGEEENTAAWVCRKLGFESDAAKKAGAGEGQARAAELLEDRRTVHTLRIYAAEAQWRF